MLVEQKLQFLKNTELFAELSIADLKSICAIAKEVAYPADHILFEEGDEGDSLYLLVDGEISIIKSDMEVLSFKEKGYCFGEVALIDNKLRSATIKTATPTDLLRISQEDFFNALAREPQIGRGMFRVLNNKIRHDLEIQMSAMRKEVAQEESMRLAAEVQQSILPNKEINHPCLTSAGFCQPTNSVGGDYYDYLYLPNKQVGIFIGDVMGHGFHSAMVAAMTKSCIQTQIRFDASVSEVMKAISRVTEDYAQTFIYMTCCYVIVHQDNRLEFANAGHPAMLLYRANCKRFIELESQFTPVGIALPDRETVTHYQSSETTWEPDDLLVLYSDGITEACNAKEEIYGHERLKNLISEKRHLTPTEIKDAILVDLETYQRGEILHDDVTLVIAKFH